MIHGRKSNYEIIEIIKNIYFLIKTKLLFPDARLIRFPIIIRGKKYIDFGKNLTTGYNCRFEVNGTHLGKILTFGKNVNIGDNVRIACAERISIGSDVLMGSKVLIIDNSHGNYSGDNQDSPFTVPNKRLLKSSAVEIGDNVWIGEGVVIQQGVEIGSGSIIAANSVVTKNIPANSIAGGIPIKIIKTYNCEKKIWENFKL